MKNYDSFAAFYDLAMGPQEDIALSILKMVRNHAPKAKTLLELGCGSGSLLRILSRHYKCRGIDLSAGMIKIAKRKVKGVPFEVGDITKLKLDERYDVILCAFDTINHIGSFDKWLKVFKNAYQHLNPGGTFIFDINSITKIARYDSEPPYVQVEKDAVATFEVRWKKYPRYTVDINVFKKQRADNYKLHQMRVNGIVFPVHKILAALEKHFSHIKMIDQDRPKVSQSSEEIYFVCRK